MINPNNLNNLYEELIKDTELTTKVLNECGFTSKDITDLIEQGKIERIKRGYYKFLVVDDLFYYGKKLIADKEHTKATKCFEKCYEINPNHIGTCFQLFIRSINEKDYATTFKYFETLLNTDNSYYDRDYNFYLYLLSLITDIPEKYKEYARHLKLEDIRVDYSDKRYKDIPLHNKLRLSVLQRKLPFALKQLKDITVKHGAQTIQEILIRTLIIQAINVEVVSEKTILNLINTKQYYELISHLENKEKRNNLSMIDNYTLKLTEILLYIKKSNKIPTKTFFQTEKMFEAIDGYNFELAFKLNKDYNEANNIENETSTFYLLLLEICNLIQELSSPKEIEVENTDISEKTEAIEDKPVEKIETTYLDVINYLIKSDVDNAINTLKDYLNTINKNEYIYLIINLIKLSLLENDITFTKPIIALTYISRDNYNFDLSEYIQGFYIAISQNKLEQARIYLDIIKDAKRIGKECIFIDSLIQVLDNAEKTIKNKTTPKDINLNITDTKISLEQPKEEISEKIEVPIEAPLHKETKSNIQPDIKELDSSKTRDSEREFIERKSQELLDKRGIILLKPMDSERRKRTHDIIKGYPDIVSFSIGEEPNRQIVLRYKPSKLDEPIDYKEIMKKAKEAYSKGECDECIDLHKQLLSVGNPTGQSYAVIGICLLKKGFKDTAIDYLTIATEINKQKGKSGDYTELIAELKGIINIEEEKPKVKMSLEEFDNPVGNYYGIENFEEINSYIIESGLDVESACISLKLNEEQRTRIILLYAREYYSQGQYEKGDEFIKAALQNKNKSKFTLRTIEELIKNKKFYINRNNNKNHTLTLTLKPGKRKKTSSK